MTSSFLGGEFSSDRFRTDGPGGPKDHERAVKPARGNALPPGTRLDEYELGPLLSESPLGLVYLATDHSLGREVAIREYLPQALSGRGEGALVALRSADLSGAYRRGLGAFIEEARLLARFDDPSLLRVLRFWEAHFTAYIVMPYYDAPTLTAARERLEAPPAEPWIRSLVESLANALELLHGESCLHRNVTPDRVLMLRDGRPMLLGPSAVRQVLGREAHTTLIQPGFSAIEEYAESSDLPQGPWTDVYALGALARFCILGIAPVAATVRSVRDPLVGMQDALFPLGVQWPTLTYSPSLLHAIDRALAVDPARRPQSMAEFRALLREPLAAGTGGLSRFAAVDASAPAAGGIFDPTRIEPDLHLLSATDLEANEFEANLRAMVDAALVDAPPMRSDLNAASTADDSTVPNFRPSAGDNADPAVARATEAAVDAQVPDAPSPSHEPSFGAQGRAGRVDHDPEPALIEAFAIPADGPDDARTDGVSARFAPSPRPTWQRPWTAAAAVMLLVAFGYVGWTQYQRQKEDDHIASRVELAPLPDARPASVAPVESAAGRAGALDADATPDPIAEASAHPPAAGSTAAAKPDADAPAPVESAAAATPSADVAPGSDAVSASASVPSSVQAPAPAPAPAPDPTPVRSARLARAAQHEARVERLQSSPRAVCGSRSDFALYYCMEKQCDKPQFDGHAQCRQFKLENRPQ